MTADQSRTHLDEVPFRRSGLDDVAGVYAHGVEYLGKFVHEGDVDVSLGVLDDLGGFCHLDGRSLVGTVYEDCVVDGINDICNLRGGT